MTNNTDSGPTIIPAPPGLTAIDEDGQAMPIVALQLEPNDRDTRAIPLYLSTSGNIISVWPGAAYGLSEAWIPIRTTTQAVFEAQ